MVIFLLFLGVWWSRRVHVRIWCVKHVHVCVDRMQKMGFTGLCRTGCLRSRLVARGDTLWLLHKFVWFTLWERPKTCTEHISDQRHHFKFPIFPKGTLTGQLGSFVLFKKHPERWRRIWGRSLLMKVYTLNWLHEICVDTFVWEWWWKYAEGKQRWSIFVWFLIADGTDSVQFPDEPPADGSCDRFTVVPFRWPTLLPILDPHYVAKKIIHAVLTDQVYLLLPRSMYFIAALKKWVHCNPCLRAFSIPYCVLNSVFRFDSPVGNHKRICKLQKVAFCQRNCQSNCRLEQIL